MKRLYQRVRDWLATSEAIPARWLRAAHDALLGEMPTLAAGTALFAIVAAVPTIAAVVAIYGLVANPDQIHAHLTSLGGVVPADVVSFLGDQLTLQAKRSSGELGLQIATSVVLAVISARGSAQSLIAALNRAYRVREQRGWLWRQGLALGMAFATLIGVVILLGTVVFLPLLVGALGLHGYHLVTILRWPSLLAIVFAALFGLYRFGPSPRPLGERHVWPGAAIATLLLVVVSGGLSLWVERVSNYQLFYGAFGSVIVIVLWFYLSTIALVIGGFVNAEIERHSGAPEPERSMY